jgi:hypothetical protein
MVVTEAGTMILVKSASLKALSPMVSSSLPLSKITLPVKAEQLRKASSAILVTGAGMVIDPDAGTMLQLSATHVCPLPASVYGVAAAHSEHPLVPPLEVPE